MNDRLPYMMMPANFYKTDVKQYTRDQTQSNDGNGTSANKSSNNTYTLSNTDSEGDNKSAQVGRAATAANSQETTNLERQMYDGLKMTTFKKGSGKRKNINVTMENGNLKKIEAVEAREEQQDDSNVVPFEGTRDLPHLYAQQSISTSGNLAKASASQTSEGMTLFSSGYETNFTNTTHMVGHIAGGINIKSYTSTEADVNVLRLEIPRIRSKF